MTNVAVALQTVKRITVLHVVEIKYPFALVSCSIFSMEPPFPLFLAVSAVVKTVTSCQVFYPD